MDIRLLGVWQTLWEYEDDLDGFTLGVLLRMAYAAGYADALRDTPRGAFFRRHGIEIPRRERG